MPSDRFSVQRISELARIDLSASESDQSERELERILEFIGILEELDLSGVEPFFGIREATSVSTDAPVRADRAGPSTPREEILRNAPDQDGQFFHVPAVFD